MFNLIMFTVSGLALAIVVRGWVLSVMWGWFIAPLGVPEITIASAIGISLVVALLTNKTDNSGPTEKRSVQQYIEVVVTHAFLAPLMTLLFGWLVVQFV